jgi:enoyl-CoA hydratase/carnithine racemase
MKTEIPDLTGYAAKNFLWRVDNRVGYLTLNRPDRKNPLTFESYAELRDLFRLLHDGGGVRVVVVDGAGGNFCSGGDVHEIIGPLTKMDEKGLFDFTRMTGDLIRAMRACPQPIVAAVDGVCAGAGAMIALASDFRLATPAAKTASCSCAATAPDATWAPRAPCRSSSGRALSFSTGRSFDSADGRKEPIFNSIVPADELKEAAAKLASGLASGPTLAHALTKKMLHLEWNMGVNEALDAEARAQAGLMKSNDFRRAFEAFAEKKKPVFEGD